MDSNEDEKRQRVAKRLQRPDGVIFTSDAEIIDRIRSYTVAVMMPDGGQGSGVLVQLWARYFLLTAGHVVHAVEPLATRGVPVNLVLAKAIHDAKFTLARSNRVSGTVEDDGDFGYFELPAVDAQRVRAQEKVFAGPPRIEVLESAVDDLYVVAGYPGHRTLGRPDATTWVQHHHWTSSAAGYRGVPVAPLPAKPALRVISLSIDPSEIVLDVVASTPHKIQFVDAVDPMSGASGGPCWRTYAPPHVPTWTADAMKIVATHRGRILNATVADGSLYSFAREVSIGHHLRMIAEDYPDLRDRIMDEWPILESFPSSAELRGA